MKEKKADKMKIDNLHPDFSQFDSASGFQLILRNIFVRTNLVPGVRYVIGWRGVKDSSLDTEGWTAKIDGMPGIFGVYHDSSADLSPGMMGRFILCYFPHPDEELVEFLSVEAGMETQRSDYFDRVRMFLQYPDFSDLFDVGVITMGINDDRSCLSLGLESLNRQQIVAGDGILLPSNGEMVEVVPPGGLDQDFPSYETAWSFFRVLAASMTFNLETVPVYLRRGSEPGTRIIFNAEGDRRAEPSPGIMKEYFFLSFSDKNFTDEKLPPMTFAEPGRGIVVWHQGEDVPAEYADEAWWKAASMSNLSAVDKTILGIDNRPELIVVTGFLGSGKTTFLRNFIEYQVSMSRFVAVIQNEIGEVGLDGKLLDQDYAVTEIDEGCICCSLVGNLKSAIHGILSEFQPDYIILETTGLANPANLLDELGEVQELIRFDSVTTIVDALNIEESIENYSVAVNQVRVADVILLNKKDMITEQRYHEVSAMLREVNPSAPLVPVQYGNINPSLIYGDRTAGEEMNRGGAPQEQTHDTCACHGEEDHHSHENDALSSVKIDLSKPLNQEDFLQSLESLPEKIFRVKGIVAFEGDEKPMVVQYVAGRYEISEYDDPRYEERFLIVIGQDLKKEFSPEMLQRYAEKAS